MAKAKRKTRTLKKSLPARKKSRTGRSDQSEALKQELKKALEQQAATAEILRVISSSPTDVRPVMDTIAASAARLCAADDVHIFRVDGDDLRLAASYGSLPPPHDRAISRDTVRGRAVVDRKTIHIHDFRAVAADFPERRSLQRDRTLLATPLLREGVAIGVIAFRRTEVRPFSDKQIRLLETFADQAVIAIENVRLFQELKESLEQQTATSEILGVIASSPTDIQPVLDAVAKSAARLCEASDAQIRLIENSGLKLVASFGSMPAPGLTPLSPRNISGQSALTRKAVHVHDLAAAVKTEFPESEPFQKRTGARTFLSTPMVREGSAIGVINVELNRFAVGLAA